MEAAYRRTLARPARALRPRDGTWDRLLAHAQTRSDAVGELEWIVSVDSTSVRAHQHAAGARHHPGRGDLKGGSSVTKPRRSAGPGAG